MLNLLLKIKSKIIEYIIYIVSIPFVPLNLYFITKYARKGDEYSPIFIVGAPRTGSTILYQSLTNEADVLYIDNIASKLNRVFFLAFWLSNKLFKQRAHNCFKSNHGNTSKYGWHAPSECGQFWYRWIPKGRHFIDFDEISDKNISKIKKEILAVAHYYKKPILFKNLNAGQRLRVLVKAFPDAKIIFVRRDPLDTAQSILKAKRKLKISDNQFWSIMPSNVDVLKQLKWPEQIVKQIYFLEKQIAEDLKLFPPQNVYEVHYSELSQLKLTELLSNLALNERVNYKKSEIDFRGQVSLLEEEVQLIEDEIKKLDWSETYVK
jgi:hypothetical protein